MPDYRVQIIRPDQGDTILYASNVSSADSPRHALDIGMERFRHASKSSLTECWVEVYELPDDIIVLRLPAGFTNTTASTALG